MQGIDRDSSKTLNFGMAYGEGRNSVTRNLMCNELIIRQVGARILQMVEAGTLDPALQEKKFRDLCTEYAHSAYERYHEQLPGIKETSYLVGMTCKVRGFIFNAYGRRGYIPTEYSYKSFNRLIQSCAADIMKERMVAIAPRYSKESREWNLFISSNVHDENLSEVALEFLREPKLHEYVTSTLENTSVKFRVPIKTGLGISPNNWAEASGKATIRNKQGDILAGRIK